MTPFTSTSLYDFPLTPDSVVLDIGGFHGEWSKTISQKYGCSVHAYEPIVESQREFFANLLGHPNVHLHCFGVGGESGMVTLKGTGNCCGAYNDCGHIFQQECEIQSIQSIMAAMPERVAVAKINIEGMEYDLLESAIKHNLLPRFDYIVCQFHYFFPGCEQRREAIRAKLSETHEELWPEHLGWQGWRRKG